MNEIDEKLQQPIPDDQSGIIVQAMIKIFDPETEEIFVEKRA
jgi:hypothetical protein